MKNISKCQSEDMCIDNTQFLTPLVKKDYCNCIADLDIPKIESAISNTKLDATTIKHYLGSQVGDFLFLIG